MSVLGWIKCYLGLGNEEDDLIDERTDALVSMAFLFKPAENEDDSDENVTPDDQDDDKLILFDYKGRRFEFLRCAGIAYEGKWYELVSPITNSDLFEDYGELVFNMSGDVGKPTKYSLIFDKETVEGVRKAVAGIIKESRGG